MFVYGLVLWFDFEKGVCMRRFLFNVHLLMTEFDCPEVTLCG